MEERYLTVSAITRYLKARFDGDDNLRYVFLKGEISNFKRHTSGHLYFSIKDKNSKINAIMFNRNSSNLDFSPEDGSKVLLQGRISIYEPTGGYQIYVEKMIEDGVGNLYIAYEKLKKKLKDEGLFDEKYKKKLVKYPKKVGIVTASTGAAVRDIITTIKRRYPICETILFPSLVQGEGAKDSIVKNIKKAEEYNLDVLIVGRGGGSIEDLWPFNEEEVARAIFACNIPVISAVGHEIDFTISDFVADLRAPTPTAAAELAVPNLIEIKNYLKQISIRLNESINKKINYQKLYLESLKSSYVLMRPFMLVENRKEKLDLSMKSLNDIMLNKVCLLKEKNKRIKENIIFKNPEILYKEKRMKLVHNVEKLELLNPLTILKRGYSVVYKDEKVVKNINDIKNDDKINVKMNNGVAVAKVIEVKENACG